MVFKLDNRSIIGLSILWVFAAIFIDRYFLQSVRWYSEILVFKNFEFTATSISRKISWLGLTSAIITPSIIASLIWTVIKMVKRELNLNDFFGHVGNILKWSMVVVFLVWIGDVIYRLIFKGLLGNWSFTKGLVNILDNISIKGDLILCTKYIYTFTYNLGAIVGLIFGFKFLLKKTFWEYVINDAKSKFSFLRI